MQFLNFLTFITAVISLTLGGIVLWKGKFRGLYVSFFIFALIDAVWAYTNFHFLVIDHSLLIFRSQYAFGSAMLVSALSWIIYLTETNPSRLKIALILPLGLVLSALPYIDGLIIHAIVAAPNGQFTFETGPLFTYYGAILLILLISLLTKLVVAYRHASGLNKMQLRYVVFGISVFAVISIAFGVVLPIFNINPIVAFDAQSSLVWVAATAYAIVAHQLFDIRVIIKRAVVYSGLLIFTILAYIMVILISAAILGREDVFNINNFLVNLFAAVVIAAGFEPLRQWLARVTDKYLFVGEYDAQASVAELAQTLTNVLDLDDALKATMTVLTKALRAKQSATFILASDKGQGMVLKRVQGLGYTAEAQKALVLNQALISYFDRLTEDYVVTEDLAATAKRLKQSGYETIIAALQSFGAAVALPIRVSGKLIGVLVVGPKLSGEVYSRNDLQFLDVAAKQTATAIQKSRFYEDDQMKSEFVSIASHELLTPTAAIEGYLSMILDEKMAVVDPKAEAYLRKVQGSAHRLAELVKDLLSVSRIEGGRIVINKQPTDAAKVIQDVIGEIQVRADQAHIALSYLAPAQPLPKVLADPDRLAQVVTNLISNAIKYNRPNGSVAVSTAVDAKFLTIHVADSGIGISPTHIPHLFKKFYRVHDDNAAAEKVGTGLGLYITRSIIELQGGQIWVHSEANRGSVFSFTLPLA